MISWRLVALVALLLSGALLVGDAARLGTVLARAEPAPGADEVVRALGELGYATRFVRADPAVLADAPTEGSGLVVLGGGRPWTAEELEALAAFVADGGRALVLGEPGAARVLGVAMAASPVLDPLGAQGVRIRVAQDGRNTEGVWTAAHPVQDGRPGGRVLAWSADGTFVDADGDGVGREGDVPGPFALAIATPEGTGVVIGAVAPSGDPLRALVTEAFPSGTEVIVDDTRSAAGGDVPLRALAGALLHLGHAPMLATVHVALATLAGGALAWRGVHRTDGGTARTLDEPVPCTREGSP